ncbi:MAG: AAA family ATPase, partial [Verrucomicrobiae bacterium]|nr:AAA family ATPase [Verrucomicrobiae bacterium]
MYLKSLQLIGFKSFAEKTTLEFVPGVTAIVGPNGCGKSNVADAIRWVLGEQSAKALRGSEMADVIFSGSDGRKPINMAEVSMTFADVEAGCISLPGVPLDFNEVTITRRVYRDGTGEYFINKTPCRLRDIQNMFMDTGIGRSSYSLMAQGQIDQILSSHPEDRRTIFEEAAGINKYKHQKKEALRKLELTEQNLVRLTDIIKEVKRQIISLQRQAGKARRYKELFEQLKALDTKLCRHRYDLLKADIARLQGEIERVIARSDRYTTEIAACETQLAGLRRGLDQLEHAITELDHRDHDLRNESDRHHQRIATNHERISESEQTIQNNQREIARLEERIHLLEHELARLDKELQQATLHWETEQARLRDRQQALSALDADLAQKERALREANAVLVDTERQISDGRNELSALDHRSRNDKIRAERLSTERLQLQEQHATKHQELQEFERSLQELRACLAPLRVAISEREAALATVSQQLAWVSDNLRSLEAESLRKSERLDLLRKFFGTPDGHCALAQILDVDPGHAAAIEAALFHALRTILADDLAAARTLLADNAVTAPELLPASASCPAESQGNAAPDVAVPLPALAVVSVRDRRFAPLGKSLLADVVIAENLDAALALRAS